VHSAEHLVCGKRCFDQQISRMGDAPGEEPDGDWAVLMGRLQSLLDVSPVMLILRGVPGSGKSTLVHTIVEGFPESLVCSADHYFEKENGEYVFDRNLLKDAHADCQRRARDAMSGGGPLVVIDNTCVKHWEYKKYEAMAAEAGYQVQIASLECDSIAVGVLARLLAGRNSHQVPEATILNMLRNWYNDERSFKIEIRGLPGSDETAPASFALHSCEGATILLQRASSLEGSSI